MVLGRLPARSSSASSLETVSYTHLGAKEVTAVDISEAAVQLIEKNAALNGADITAVCANCFDFLRAQVKAGEKYDVVVLDPPAFTKAHANMASACRGYKEIADVYKRQDQSIFIAVRQLFVYNKNVMDFCASPPDGLAQDRCSVGMTSASAMDGNPKRRLKKCVCLKLRRRQSAKERKFLWQKTKTET